MLAGMRQQQAAGSVDDLARQAEAHGQPPAGVKRQNAQAFGAPGSKQAQGATRQQAEELAREKEQMANDYQRLEQTWERPPAIRWAGNRQLSSKLRDALGQVQQNEINNRLRLSADWLRTGRGPHGYHARRRDHAGAEQLARPVARDSESRPGSAAAAGSGDKDRQALEQALAQTERLRKEMERGMRRSRGQQGAEPGQQSGEQPGQHGQPGRAARPATRPAARQNRRASSRAKASPAARSARAPTARNTACNRAPVQLSGMRATSCRITATHCGNLENNPQIGKDLRDCDPRHVPPRSAPVARQLPLDEPHRVNRC